MEVATPLDVAIKPSGRVVELESQKAVAKEKTMDLHTTSTSTTKNDMRRLHAVSEAFEKKSTELSNRLQAACSFIDGLPYKLPVSVGEGDERLMLRRTQDGWALCYGAVEGCKLVARGSSTLKAKAAVLLGLLFAKLSDSISLELSKVEVGLEALKDAAISADEVNAVLTGFRGSPTEDADVYRPPNSSLSQRSSPSRHRTRIDRMSKLDTYTWTPF